MPVMAETTTFGLVHGAWHGAWCWQYVSSEIERAGYDSVAVDLPIDNPAATFDDYAAVAAERFEKCEDLVLVGHSRAGNVLPRMAGLISIRKMIYIAGSFQPITLKSLGDKTDKLPSRALPRFLAGIRETGDNMTVFDPDLAGDVFYHDCSDADKEWAISQLRPQRSTKDDPPLEAWPEIAQDYIVCSEERVINPEWSRRVCALLGITVHHIESGHSPFLSRPKELSSKLIELAGA